MKTNLEPMNSRVNATEQISDLEDRIMEITKWEEQTERQWKNKCNIWDLRDDFKHDNGHIIGVIERKENNNWKCIWRSYGWKLPNPKEENRYQVQEGQKVPNKMNPKRPIPRHIIIKMMNLFYLIWLCHIARRISVPNQRLNPGHAVKVPSPKTQLPGNSLKRQI